MKDSGRSHFDYLRHHFSAWVLSSECLTSGTEAASTNEAASDVPAGYVTVAESYSTVPQCHLFCASSCPRRL